MTDLLEQHFARTVNPVDDSDWLAVVRRARRPRKRAAGVAIAAAALAILVTPAVGVGGELLDLVRRPPAPPEVQRHFAESELLRKRLFAHAAAAGDELRGRYDKVIPGNARGVAAIESPDGPIYLWVAPTGDGSHCWLIQADADPATRRPHVVGGCDAGNVRSGLSPRGITWMEQRPSVRIVHARVFDERIVRVEIRTEAGPATVVPVAAGHALGTVAKDARVTALVGRDADGAVRASVAMG